MSQFNAKTQIKMHSDKRDGAYIEKIDKIIQATKIQHGYKGEYEIISNTRRIGASHNYKTKFSDSDNQPIIYKGINVAVQTDDEKSVEIQKATQCNVEEFCVEISKNDKRNLKNTFKYKKINDKYEKTYMFTPIEKIGKRVITVSIDAPDYHKTIKSERSIVKTPRKMNNIIKMYKGNDIHKYLYRNAKKNAEDIEADPENGYFTKEYLENKNIGVKMSHLLNFSEDLKQLNIKEAQEEIKILEENNNMKRSADTILEGAIPKIKKIEVLNDDQIKLMNSKIYKKK